MLFNSLHFLIFLPVVFILHWLIPVVWRRYLLLAASYYFYMSWNPWFGVLLAGTTIIDWYVALKIQQTTNAEHQTTNNKQPAKKWLSLSILTNLGCLAGFKYFAFVYNTFAFAGSHFADHSPHYVEAILVPVGLSFYVFHSMGYVIDVYRGKLKAEKDPATFALFVSFFPQLVAGPIARFQDLGVQFHDRKYLTKENILLGSRLLLWGFFKKIAIADRLADFVNPLFNHPENYNGLSLLIAGFFFVVQVYCDFSGYSDIATGVAKFFGYNLQLNWRRPLLSKSLHEFWSRNHISMTTWFRDYLYISLGGNRGTYKRFLLNVFLVFLISGLWHGAKWTFVIWGAMHGIVYLIEILIRKIKKNKQQTTNNKRPHLAGWFYLMLFHTISLIAFRANSFHDLGVIYHKIFSFRYDLQTAYLDLRTLKDLFPLLIALLAILFLFMKELNEENGWLNKIPSYEKWLRPAFYTLLFILLFTIGNFTSNEFIYFHF
ncbi:MAG: MBOAT family protein [Bacteroidota bacterium]|nr:MBOAT family protein [Bacteroidota bacterium]